MPAHSLTREESAARRARVIEMRRERRPWDEIGRAFDVSAQRAHRIYREALDEWPVARLEEHRAEEGELIDAAVRDLLTIATSPATGARTRVEAWTGIRGWSEHRARLFGLNAPTRSQVDMVMHDGLTAEMERLAAELGESDARVGEGERARIGAALSSATSGLDTLDDALGR